MGSGRTFAASRLVRLAVLLPAAARRAPPPRAPRRAGFHASRRRSASRQSARMAEIGRARSPRSFGGPGRTLVGRLMHLLSQLALAPARVPGPHRDALDSGREIHESLVVGRKLALLFFERRERLEVANELIRCSRSARPARHPVVLLRVGPSGARLRQRMLMRTAPRSA